MQRVPARIGRRIVGFGAGRLAGFATDANAGVVEQSDRGAGDRDILRLCVQRRSTDADGNRSGHSGLGDGGNQFRRVMSTSVLFLLDWLPDDALSFSAWARSVPSFHAGLLAALEALRSDHVAPPTAPATAPPKPPRPP